MDAQIHTVVACSQAVNAGHANLPAMPSTAAAPVVITTSTPVLPRRAASTTRPASARI